MAQTSTFDFWDPPELFLDFWERTKNRTLQTCGGRLLVTYAGLAQGVGSYNPRDPYAEALTAGNKGIPNLQKVGIVLLETKIIKDRV